MSLVTLSHVCSHLQNATRARLSLTSIPYTNLTLSISHLLLGSGFISRLALGTQTQPAPAEQLHITQRNIAQLRLWLSLKYSPRTNDPVLSSMRMVSRPTRRIWLDTEALGRIVRGRDAGYVDGLRNPGECLFVSTDRGVMEVREAVRRRVGGMVLCRVL
jgi:ribosomal protein S8